MYSVLNRLIHALGFPICNLTSFDAYQTPNMDWEASLCFINTSGFTTDFHRYRRYICLQGCCPSNLRINRLE